MSKKGFTLVEMIVVLAIFAALGVFAALNFSGSRGKSDLDGTTKDVVALLREAQSDAVAQEGGTAWGVHFENATATAPFYALFASSTYSTGTTVGRYRLPATVGYATTTLSAGSTTDIIFSQITGAASASTSIQIYSRTATSLSSTISVASSGEVSY